MKTVIINGHPDPDTSHTQRFFYEAVSQEDQVSYVELAKLSEEQWPSVQYLIGYDRIILQFPVYWYAGPALLKTWIDRTFTSPAVGLAGKAFGLVVAFDTPAKDYQAGGKSQYTVSEMLRPYEMLANYFDMDYLPPLAVHQWRHLDQEGQWQLLVAYRLYVLGPKRPNFAQQGEWLAQELGQLQLDNVEAVIEAMRERADQLAELRMLIEGGY